MRIASPATGISKTTQHPVTDVNMVAARDASSVNRGLPHRVPRGPQYRTEIEEPTKSHFEFALQIAPHSSSTQNSFSQTSQQIEGRSLFCISLDKSTLSFQDCGKDENLNHFCICQLCARLLGRGRGMRVTEVRLTPASHGVRHALRRRQHAH